MGKFINPFTDVGFKRIFGQAVNKGLLIDFLNSLLEGERRVTDLTFLDKEMLPRFDEDRGVIYDVYCKDENGEEFIVEMQNREHANFKERAVYYLSQAIVRQGERGMTWKYALKAVYGVFFINFRLPGTRTRKLRTDVALEDRATHEPFSDKMRFIFIELPSFTKEESECENDFERWIYVLKNMETLRRMPFKARSEVFKELEKIADLASLTREDRMKYDQSIKMYRDNLVVREFEEMQRVQREKEEARLKEMRLDIEKRQAQLFKQQAQVEKQQAQVEKQQAQVEKQQAQVEKQQAQVDELEAHMREEQAKIERERATIRAEREKMEKGKEETRIEVGRRLKALGMDAGTIAAATGLSAEEIEAL